MVNDLTVAIAKAIKKEFQEVDILTEQLEQGFTSPCFFIFCESQKEHDKLEVRFLAEHTFVIQYFPKDGNSECWEVLSKLHRLLEFVTLEDGSMVAGTNRNGTIREGILFFFVDYDFYRKKEKQPEEYMRELQVHEKTRKRRN